MKPTSQLPLNNGGLNFPKTTIGASHSYRAQSQFPVDQVSGHIAFTGFLTNKLLTALPGEDFARLLPHCEPIQLFSGQELRKPDEPIEFVYFPETAVLSHVFFLEDGSSTGAALVGNDGLIGLCAILDAQPPSYWTHVVIGGTALRVRVSIIKQEFARGDTTQKLLLSYTNKRLTQLSLRAVCNSRHWLEQRLCTWLLMVRDRTSEEYLPLTHEQIASELGARRAGVTSACSTLKDSGIIKYRRGRIIIVDRERLEEVACECYRALKQSETKLGVG
jgi:CRP-like cAMP-binding protein